LGKAPINQLGKNIKIIGMHGMIYFVQR